MHAGVVPATFAKKESVLNFLFFSRGSGSVSLAVPKHLVDRVRSRSSGLYLVTFRIF